jgi:hypothetical protein
MVFLQQIVTEGGGRSGGWHGDRRKLLVMKLYRPEPVSMVTPAQFAGDPDKSKRPY